MAARTIQPYHGTVTVAASGRWSEARTTSADATARSCRTSPGASVRIRSSGKSGRVLGKVRHTGPRSAVPTSLRWSISPPQGRHSFRSPSRMVCMGGRRHRYCPMTLICTMRKGCDKDKCVLMIRTGRLSKVTSTDTAPRWQWPGKSITSARVRRSDDDINRMVPRNPSLLGPHRNAGSSIYLSFVRAAMSCTSKMPAWGGHSPSASCKARTCKSRGVIE